VSQALLKEGLHKRFIFNPVLRKLTCMKILWVSPFLLHPTTRGAQIRTLCTLKELHRRHDIFFAALNDPENREGPSRCSEYSARSLWASHHAPPRLSPAFFAQLTGSLADSRPLAISRYASRELKSRLEKLLVSEAFDCIVCDFLAAAPNIPALRDCVLFEHNVETTIFDRHAEQSSSRLRKKFFSSQATKMRAYEMNVCRAVKHVIAVSDTDAARIRSDFGARRVSSVRTGVDTDYFAPRGGSPYHSDLLFCGSMDWLPNIDAVRYFVAEILPLIRATKPKTTFTIAGRSPDESVLKAIANLPGVFVTGTVEDMRPYLWGSKISVVPLRIGGGTRLKIYESMAAGAPVVSTTVGAEGLKFTRGRHLAIADTARAFADACIHLLSSEEHRWRMAHEARAFVERELSWEVVARDVEQILESCAQRNRVMECVP
jgi:glycosyltransferase involved in cell wall biosynthesis